MIKSCFLPSLLAGVFLVLVGINVANADDLSLPREAQSYAAGVNASRLYLAPGVDIDLDAFIKGLKDQFQKKKLAFSEKQIGDMVGAMQAETKRKTSLTKTSDESQGRQIEPAFLELNQKRYGVVTTASGLHFKVKRESTDASKSPTDDDEVTFKYRATTVKGNLLSESGASTPYTIKVRDLAPGLREAVKLMSDGARWEFFMPASLGVCTNLTSKSEESTKVVVYDIELLSVKPAKAQ